VAPLPQPTIANLPTFSAEQDLLGLGHDSASLATPNAAASDAFGFGYSAPHQQSEANNGGEQDILGLFSSVAISGPAAAPDMQVQQVSSGDRIVPLQQAYGVAESHTPPRQLTPSHPIHGMPPQQQHQNPFGQVSHPPPALVPPSQLQPGLHPSGQIVRGYPPPQQMQAQYPHAHQAPLQQPNYYGGQQPSGYGMPPPPQHFQQHQQQMYQAQQQLMAQQSQPQGGAAPPNVRQFDPFS
jgi:hypothetical protein